MRPVLRPAAAAILAAAFLGIADGGAVGAIDASTPFGAEIERLSEPPGAFDTDNLISNERAYLEVVPDLVAGQVTGGAYLGVGPDQNFSYIARVRPSVAFIIDVRRDNLLLHLLFKALFVQAHTRIEYLSMLTGRAPPDDLDRWRTAELKEIVAYLDGARSTPALSAWVRKRLDDTIGTFGVALGSADHEAIARFHHEFIRAGLGIQFHSFNRPPQPYYPTLRQLLLATDASGHMWNYLASESDFQFVRTLETSDKVIPVVGDVAGPHAMRAIAEALIARHERLSAFYISNVENYLFRDGSFGAFSANLTRLPRSPQSVMIRSIFSGAGQSVSVVQPLGDMVKNISQGKYRSYGDLVRTYPGTMNSVRRLIVASAVAAGLAVPGAYAQQRGRIWVGNGEFGRMPARWAKLEDFNGSFLFCRGFYSSNRYEDGGMGWWTDYPGADNNFSVRLGELTKANVPLDESYEPNFVVVRLDDPLLDKCPLLYMEDVGTARFSDDEVKGLRDYLLKGGFLQVDDFWGTAAWQQWVEEIQRVLPAAEYPIFDIPPTHSIMHVLYDVKAVEQVSSIQFWRRGHRVSERGSDSAQVDFRGIQDARGRLMVVMRHNTDIPDTWEREGESREYFDRFSPAGYAIGVNSVVYGLTH